MSATGHKAVPGPEGPEQVRMQSEAARLRVRDTSGSAVSRPQEEGRGPGGSMLNVLCGSSSFISALFLTYLSLTPVSTQPCQYLSHAPTGRDGRHKEDVVAGSRGEKFFNCQKFPIRLLDFSLQP